MKSRNIALSRVFFLFFLFSMAVFGQCTKDTECKGNRICVNGVCVDPAAASPAMSKPVQGQAIHTSGEHAQVQTAFVKEAILALTCLSSKPEYNDQAVLLLKSAKKELETINVFSSFTEGTAAQADYVLTLTITDMRKISRGQRVMGGMAAGPAMISLIAELKDKASGEVLMRESIEKSSVGFGVAGATTETVMKEASETLADIIQKKRIAGPSQISAQPVPVMPAASQENQEEKRSVPATAPQMDGDITNRENAGTANQFSCEGRGSCGAGQICLHSQCLANDEVISTGNVSFGFAQAGNTVATLAVVLSCIPYSLSVAWNNSDFEPGKGPLMPALAIQGGGIAVGSAFWLLTKPAEKRQKNVLKELGGQPPETRWRKGRILQLSTVVAGVTSLVFGLCGGGSENNGLVATATVLSYAAAGCAVSSYIVNASIYARQRHLLEDTVKKRQASLRSDIMIAPYAAFNGKKACAGLVMGF